MSAPGYKTFFWAILFNIRVRTPFFFGKEQGTIPANVDYLGHCSARSKLVPLAPCGTEGKAENKEEEIAMGLMNNYNESTRGDQKREGKDKRSFRGRLLIAEESILMSLSKILMVINILNLSGRLVDLGFYDHRGRVRRRPCCCRCCNNYI